MSPFQIVLLAIFGASAIAAVLTFAILTSSNAGASLGPVTVWGTFSEETVQSVLRDLGETEDRIKSVSYVRKNPETYERELTEALASGAGPDLFFVRQDYAYSHASKIAAIPLESFSRQQFTDMFIEGASPFISAEGVLAVPLFADPFVMYWNRDMLATAGFAQPPVFWDELYNMARVMTRRDDANSIVEATIAFGEFINVSHAKHVISMLIMQAGGPITTRDTTGQLNPSLIARTGDVVRPAESAVSFFVDFANPSAEFYSWNRALPQSRVAFANGDLAFYFGPASEEMLISRSNPNLNFAIAPVPQIKNIDTDVDVGYVYAIAIPKTAQNPQGALTAAYLLGSQNATRALAQALGYVSARRDVLSVSAQGTDEIIRRQALLIRSWEDPNPVETDKIFKDMIEGVTSGAVRVTEAVQRAELAMRQLVAP